MIIISRQIMLNSGTRIERAPHGYMEISKSACWKMEPDY